MKIKCKRFDDHLKSCFLVYVNNTNSATQNQEIKSDYSELFIFNFSKQKGKTCSRSQNRIFWGTTTYKIHSFVACLYY